MRKTTSYSCHLFASILVALLSALLLTACIRETEYGMPETTYISVKISPNNARTDSRADQKEGDPLDNEVKTLRIMAFKPDGNIAENHYFNNVSNGQVVEFSIIVGNYDLVFIANEPESLESELSNLITSLTDLEAVAFPASAFDSHLPIPMLQKINNVTITENGKAILVAGTKDIHGYQGRYYAGETTGTINLGLDRLGARVDITLETTMNLPSAMIQFSGLPDKVPLFGSIYSPLINYTGTRNGNAGYFDQNHDPYYGTIYRYKISRIIIPSNNSSQLIRLTFNNIGIPLNWIELKIDENNPNPSLPYNSWLDVTVSCKKISSVNRGNDDPCINEGLMETNITVRNW